MAETASERPIGKRYLRYVRGLPKHPERAFGEHAEDWRFKEGDEVFTATRRTHDKVWRVIFELDDGGTFLRNGDGDKGNLMCISPMDPRGSLMIRDSTVFSIDGENFQGSGLFFYEPDGRLDNVSAEFNRMKRGSPGSVFGAVKHDTIGCLHDTAGEESKSASEVCRTTGIASDPLQPNIFFLKCEIVPKRNQAIVRLERREEGFVSYTVPLRLEHPKDAVDYLRQKINQIAGQTLM